MHKIISHPCRLVKANISGKHRLLKGTVIFFSCCQSLRTTNIPKKTVAKIDNNFTQLFCHDGKSHKKTEQVMGQMLSHSYLCKNKNTYGIKYYLWSQPGLRIETIKEIILTNTWTVKSIITNIRSACCNKHKRISVKYLN